VGLSARRLTMRELDRMRARATVPRVPRSAAAGEKAQRGRPREPRGEQKAAAAWVSALITEAVTSLHSETLSLSYRLTSTARNTQRRAPEVDERAGE
jgi:hypothetical protein